MIKIVQYHFFVSYWEFEVKSFLCSKFVKFLKVFFEANLNFARASRSLYITLHDHDVKLSNYTFSGGREHRETILLVGKFDKLNDME